MIKWVQRAAGLASLASILSGFSAPIEPVVEVEEEVYTYSQANNGAGPMWCAGSTCLVRIGENLFASGLEILTNVPPLNNCRWVLYQRGTNGWKQVQADDKGRTREPSPLVGFPDGRLFLSANPTLAGLSAQGGGPARPEIQLFSAHEPSRPSRVMLPEWQDKPAFSEHSYRSFAGDSSARELILFQNIGYTHAEWTFRDNTGAWPARGKLNWPMSSDSNKPEPIRVCYPTVALQGRAVYFFGVSDIVEPNPAWREFKRKLTGQEWDYDFRRLFFTWTPDITREKFRSWSEIESREETAGWLFPSDLWVAPDGAVHLLWTERAIDERLREKFFPQSKQSHALNYAILREGKVTTRSTLLEAKEGESGEKPLAARFQVTPDHRLLVFYYVNGKDADGRPVSENRIFELKNGQMAEPPKRVNLQRPFTSFFTTTVRAGSLPSSQLELLGLRAGEPMTISYARIQLNTPQR